MVGRFLDYARYLMLGDDEYRLVTGKPYYATEDKGTRDDLVAFVVVPAIFAACIFIYGLVDGRW